MQPELAENLSNSDRVSRLQDMVDALAHSLYNAIHYVQYRAPMTVVNPVYPVTQANVNSEEEETFKRNMKLRAGEITQMVKKLNLAVNELPERVETSADFAPTYARLQEENRLRTQELLQTIDIAETLLEKVQSAQQSIIETETAWTMRHARPALEEDNDMVEDAVEAAVAHEEAPTPTLDIAAMEAISQP
ncbi:hypothetical protein RI367_008548 [Sorochytrium milnesiophthora]